MSRDPTATAPDAAARVPAALVKLLGRKEERTIADKIADSDRPSWEQFKRENKDMLEQSVADSKEMEKYRQELDADRERRMGGGRDRKSGSKKKKRKKRSSSKKKRRKRASSESSESASLSEDEADEENDEDESDSKEGRRSRHKKRKHHKKHKKRHRKEAEKGESSSSSVEGDDLGDDSKQKPSTVTTKESVGE